MPMQHSLDDMPRRIEGAKVAGIHEMVLRLPNGPEAAFESAPLPHDFAGHCA